MLACIGTGLLMLMTCCLGVGYVALDARPSPPVMSTLLLRLSASKCIAHADWVHEQDCAARLLCLPCIQRAAQREKAELKRTRAMAAASLASASRAACSMYHAGSAASAARVGRQLLRGRCLLGSRMLSPLFVNGHRDETNHCPPEDDHQWCHAHGALRSSHTLIISEYLLCATLPCIW